MSEFQSKNDTFVPLKVTILVGTVIILSLIFSALFSGIEIAFLTANRLKVELLKKNGSASAKLLSHFYSNPSKFLATTLIGNTLVLVIYGHFMNLVLEGFFKVNFPEFDSWMSKFIVTLIATLVILVFGEFLPKNLFRLNPTSIIVFFAMPMRVANFILMPFVWALLGVSNALLKAFNLHSQPQEKVFTKLDLEHFVKSVKAENDEDIDHELFENVLYLNEVKVRACMIPRKEIEAVDINTPIGELKQKFLDTRISRIVIYKGDLDEIVGYVHHQQLFKNPKSIREILMKMPLVPEAMPAKDLLHEFIKNRVNVAWVVDEYGGTAGLVALEDLLEQIFGDIDDEHDAEDADGMLEEVISEDEFRFSARLEIEYLNDKYKLNLPEGEYHTLSGYIVTETEDIPPVGQEIILGSYEFVLEEVSDTRIEVVRVCRLNSGFET